MIAAFAVVSSCTEEKPNPIENPEEFFSVQPLAIVPPAEGGEFELTVYGKETWKLEVVESNTADNEWCAFSVNSGEGQQVIKVTVQPSTSFVKNRKLVLAISTETQTLNAVIKQDTQVLGEDEVLIDGKVWATKNLDMPGTFVADMEMVGKLYQFNRKVAWPAEGDAAPEGWPAEYVNDKTNWTPENDPCPEGWRVPETAEMVALWEKGAVWVNGGERGFTVNGMIIALAPEIAATATKTTLKELGGLFLPQWGWRSENGTRDRQWLVSVRSATTLDKISTNEVDSNKGGMSLGDAGSYRDLWGWGDGQKARAGMVRCVKNIKIED